jgi:hypothetical protein
MSEGKTARSFGLPLGLLAGLFALVQIFVSVFAALASGPALRSLQQIFSGINGGPVSNPLPLVGDLAGVVFITYLASVVTGVICLCLCWYAGRQTAYVLGRHAAGARAGMLVMLISSAIWIVTSVAATLVVRADGTLSGIFTSAFAGGNLTTELILLLIQEVLAALFGLGLAALAGALGAASAPVVAPPPVAPPTFMPYPPFAGMAPPPPNWLPYPPPPSYFGWQNPAGERSPSSASEGANGL